MGFVGLGNMGGHMAKNLLKKGYPLVVCDVSKDSVQSLKEAGWCCCQINCKHRSILCVQI